MGLKTNETEVIPMSRNLMDKRVQQSRACIYTALRQLLDNKPFEKITISELTQKAGVGRATFYRNFASLEDVLMQQSEDTFDRFKQYLTSQQPKEMEGKLSLFFKFWRQHSELLETLVLAHRPGILNEAMDNLHKEQLDSVIDFQGLKPTQQKYLLAILRGMFTNILLQWIERGKKESPEQLGEMFQMPFKLYLGQLKLEQ